MKRFQYMAERSVYSSCGSGDGAPDHSQLEDYFCDWGYSRSMLAPGYWSDSFSISGNDSRSAVRSASGHPDNWRSGMSSVDAAPYAVCSVSNPDGLLIDEDNGNPV